MNEFILTANVVDLRQKKIVHAHIKVLEGTIHEIKVLGDEHPGSPYIMPGFIDAHVHIESSMLVPSEFARLAVMHGTVATVSDPHEIANVLGITGVRYMIKNNKQTPFPIFFGAPSCVPATSYETAGGSISTDDIVDLFRSDNLKYLSEMMNYPGVIHGNQDVLEKIDAAKRFHKRIDGHAPGLSGKALAQYIQQGISTDHECSRLDEALEKINLGMKILIREGSAAKNYEALKPLIHSHPDRLMFCSDDIHPNDLLKGHINRLVKRAVKDGFDLFDVLRIACINPIAHYGLEIGTLLPGSKADFIIIDNLKDFNTLATYLQGVKVAEQGRCLLPKLPIETINNFHCSFVTPEQLHYSHHSKNIRVIKIVPNELITQNIEITLDKEHPTKLPDASRDILKLVVINRYFDAPPAIAFIQGLGIKHGSIASSVAHDSHNIIAAGTDDESLTLAINAIVNAKGGLSVVKHDQVNFMALPVAGLMSDKTAEETAKEYTQIKALAKALGSPLEDPFMTLSFMALLVIPSLKLSDKGLFDAERFQFVEIH